MIGHKSNTPFFVGRDEEIKVLCRWRNSKGHSSTLTAVYGRRRIGKTRLVEQAYQNFKLWKFEGLENESTSAQKKHFLSLLTQYSARPEATHLARASWKDILIFLSDCIGVEPIAIFFDELQWLAAERQELISHLKFVWDNYFIKKNHAHLILCGSISSFIVKKVVHSRALYGRVDLELHLKPLDISATKDTFFKGRSLSEALEYTMAIGGVPEYLHKFDASNSVRLNLERLCFSPHGYFFNEFERLFVSHFGKNPIYRNIVKSLAHNKNMTREQIARICRTTLGGTLSMHLEDLELSGFIEGYNPIHIKGAIPKLKRYRISDPYLRFYFRFIAPNKKKIESSKKQLPFNQVVNEKQFEIWTGLAFELLCYQHADLIAKQLGFSSVSYEYGTWFTKRDQTSGFQIDLVFFRADKVITVCEIKNRHQVRPSIITEVEEKISKLRQRENQTIEKVLVSLVEPQKSVYDAGYFTQILTAADIF